jgi:integrase
MNWHASRSDEFRSPIVRGMARTSSKERARARVLTDDELRAVWKTAEAISGPFGVFIRFLLLTGSRRSEAADLTWDEIADGVWLLPAARNKVKQDLARPLWGPPRTSWRACRGLGAMSSPPVAQNR